MSQDFGALTIVRGYMIYAKSDNDELYEFFYPNTNVRITNKEAESLLPDGHKLITTERQTRKYSIPIKQLDTHGKVIEKK
nr:MAG TPA_asm: hypothetical protein [Caudoviricetes sp.]